MATADDNFKHVSLQDNESIIKYLDALSTGFKQGALLFNAENQQLVLKPRGLIKLEVEAKRKNDQMKLSLKMRWSEDAPAFNELSLKPIDS